MMKMTTDRHIFWLAREIAIYGHEGQVDKLGRPYILHPQAVADAVPTTRQKALAWVHDLVEDTPWTLEMLLDAGFPQDFVDEVDALTHRKNEPREEYYARVLEFADAQVVKRADVRHNLGRLDGLPAADQDRLRAKYAKALSILGEG